MTTTEGTFRKRPVEIEAVRFDGGSWPMPDWLAEAVKTGRVYYQGGADPYLTIETLEGKMRANLGDWIIKGVKGELYPCKPDIFAATYDPAALAAHTPPDDDAELAAIRERCADAYYGPDIYVMDIVKDVETLLSRLDAERARAERAEAEAGRLRKRLNTIIAGWRRPHHPTLEQKEPSR